MTMRRRRRVDEPDDIAPVLDRVEHAERAQERASDSMRTALAEVRRAVEELDRQRKEREDDEHDG